MGTEQTEKTSTDKGRDNNPAQVLSKDPARAINPGLSDSDQKNADSIGMRPSQVPPGDSDAEVNIQTPESENRAKSGTPEFKKLAKDKENSF